MRQSQGVGACEENDATSYLYRFILQVHLAASCGLAKHGRGGACLFLGSHHSYSWLAPIDCPRYVRLLLQLIYGVLVLRTCNGDLSPSRGKKTYLPCKREEIIGYVASRLLTPTLYSSPYNPPI